MCGVFGIMWHQSDRIPDIDRLEETALLLRHRGPDSKGIFSDSGIGLVHTRLSLLDLTSRSDQPFWDGQNRYCIAYNGEIYNYKELRSELEKLGRSFRTTSDTEVLLECIIQYGPEKILSKLEGMFAFAVYDTVENVLLLSRDRFGIKPLYIYDRGGVFAFASEVKALRPWIKLEPDLLTVSSYFRGYEEPTYQGRSYYKDVKFVAPGTFLKVKKGCSAKTIKFFGINEFWDPNRNEQIHGYSEKKVIDTMEESLFNAVKLQLIADVPVGTLCSGGVDSALVTAMAAKVHNNLAIFHANVVGDQSEYHAAHLTAKTLKLDLKCVEVHDEDFLTQFVEVINHYDHPFSANPHSIPFFMMSRLVQANKVKAILTGEGADECFLGYEWLAPDIRNWRRIIAKKFKKGLSTMLGFLPDWPTHKPEMGIDTNVLVAQLHNRFEYVQRYMDIKTKFYKSQPGTMTSKALKTLVELRCTLPSLLHRNDSLGMASSIESRFPFLNSNIAELAVNLPYKYKIRLSPTIVDSAHYFFENKWVLRKVAERYLPRSISHRKKLAFPTNTFERMTVAPIFFARSLIADLFDLSTQDAIYLAENSRHYFRLQLLHLEVWLHTCLYNLPKQDIVDKLNEYVTIR